ncbi:MAG: putative Serralysin precursor [Ramlibacter sp.]|jgi:serralysin|nr:putative Serralysin precursor [Ramlibacter sp.]
MATTITTDALNALLYIYNGYEDSRWNFVDAVGTPVGNPGGLGNGVSLTYSFLSSRPAWATNSEVSFGVMDAAMKAATVKVLGHISEVANIDFTKVAAQQGQITFATSDQGMGSSAWAYGPFFQQTTSGGEFTAITEVKLAGSVWVNNDIEWFTSDWRPGEFGYAMLLHEMGHALGLKHPFDGDDFGGGFILDEALDHEGNTVMSYTSAPRTLLMVDAGSSWSFPTLHPTTLMMMDIAALQHLYGANFDHESGKTVYEWGTNEELLETIWDGGGVDLIDCSNQTFTCRIDLRDGQFSSIGLRLTEAEIKLGLDLPADMSLGFVDPELRDNLYNGENNLGIAKGAIIENATGGSGSDVITGNDVANRLAGGLGNDRLTGNAGADRLDGGRGVDNMNGGAGKDLFDFNKVTDTGTMLAKSDVISGFVSGMDRIDLSTIDANTALAGNQAFTFIGAEAFSAANATGQVRFHNGVLYGSTDADTAVEFMVRLTGVATLTAADLLL